MFTGLIQTAGIVLAITNIAEGKEITIKAPAIVKEMSLGASVAVNGACLTVIKMNSDSFTIQAVHVTLQKTTIGRLCIGDEVNLELALRAGDRLGGHFVQGHVNGMGRIESIISRGNNHEITVQLAPELMHYMVKEGSIALDGISLTIADCSASTVMVSIIPHTWHVTHLHDKRIGDYLNVEVDILAKYVAQLLKHSVKKDITMSMLQEQGF